MFEYKNPNMIEHAPQRREAITRLLTDQGQVSVSDLARQWGVSEMTVRRDLEVLVAQGVAVRVHGGAVAAQSLRFGSRSSRDAKEKRTAALKVADRLPERGTVYLDGSTTTNHLAEALSAKPGLVVVTNTIDTFRAIQAILGHQAVLVGGFLNADTDNIVGPYARRMLETLTFTASFFSAYALSVEAGPTEPSAEDAEIKHLVASRSEAVHLAVNHQKLGSHAGASWSLPRARTILSTDLAPTDPSLAPYHALAATLI